MWSSGNWSMQQSAYANISAEQVDWGNLAKQWITQRDATVEALAQPPPPPPPPPSAEGFAKNEDGGSAHPQFGDGSMAPPGPPAWGWGGWGMPGSGWSMPPPGHMPPMGMPGPEASSNMDYPGYGGANYDQASSYDQQYWNQGGLPPPMAAPFMMPDVHKPFPYAGGMSHIQAGMDDSGLDAAKRRSLPAWIREGLEKVEREKQKQLEKEQRGSQPEADKEELLVDHHHNHHQQQQQPYQGGAAGHLSAERPSKLLGRRQHSRFEASDDDEEKEEASGASDTDDKPVPSITNTRPPRQKSPSPEPISEEEKQARMMMRIRQMLTEVLLEVTNTEVTAIANEVYSKERGKRAKGREGGGLLFNGGRKCLSASHRHYY